MVPQTSTQSVPCKVRTDYWRRI